MTPWPYDWEQAGGHSQATLPTPNVTQIRGTPAQLPSFTDSLFLSQKVVSEDIPWVTRVHPGAWRSTLWPRDDICWGMKEQLGGYGGRE